MSLSDWLAAPAAAPAYFIASPSWLTSVFVLEEVAAKMSADLEASFAPSLKAAIVSVKMSAEVAKSNPAALARLRDGSIPAITCSVSQPARASFSIALAASVALKAVVAPISLALSLSLSVLAVTSLTVLPSFPPIVASTFLIESSKLVKAIVEATPAAATPANKAFEPASALCILPFKPSNCLPTFCITELARSVALIKISTAVRATYPHLPADTPVFFLRAFRLSFLEPFCSALLISFMMTTNFSIVSLSCS